ncbi:unnamed protein product [Diamesa tonsa]
MAKMFGIFLLITIPSLVFSLANCPAGCNCNDDSLVVKCDEKGNLDVLPIALNPSIKHLIIKKNKIKSIDSSIQFYPDLEYLDLSDNHLLNLPSRTFQYQKKLVELHLNNNKVGQFEPSTFIGMEQLQILNMRGNFIDQLENLSFSTLQRLEELNLGKNRIANILPDAFLGLYNLKILYLDDNSLNHVPAMSFSPLANLAELFIGINSFSTIEENAFAKLKKLTTLNLNGAALHNVSLTAFVGLESLRIMDLSVNRLVRIPTKELSVLSRLEELTIGDNNFEIIPEKAFDGLTNLHMLEIINSKKLKRVQSNAFLSNGNLRSIRFISNEELSQFESNAFNGLPFLKVLVLKNNAIETLRENLYEWDNLKTLDLSENPLHCDCHLLWYKNYLIPKISVVNDDNSSVSQSSNIKCSSPPYVKDKELRKISAEFLGCTPNSDPRTQAIICGLLVISAAIITALILIAYKCRRRKFRNVLKDSGWDISSTIGRKDRDYHKTYVAPQYIDTLRKHATNSSPSHPCSMQGTNNYQQYPLSPMIPITEL